ncbi:hypothetical protein BJ912DRAFT_1058050 [Pholiota molesta]|nr:hypothetical protein BJ912DRAFT_1058050 [Pholiota molesta]
MLAAAAKKESEGPDCFWEMFISDPHFLISLESNIQLTRSDTTNSYAHDEKTLFSALAAVASLSTATAFTGRASADSFGTTPCISSSTQTTCGPSDFRVALPSNIFPGGANCCQFVQATYQGTSVVVQFTDLYLAGAGSQNISLSHQAFAVLAPLEVGTIFPVDWIFVS